MKKIISLYILMIILIAVLAVLINTPQWDNLFPLIKFPKDLHVIIEGANSILMFLIFIVANSFYSKTKDERLVILAGGFLAGAILNTIHIITVKAFPYDLISIANLQSNPTIVYLLFGNLILPLAIYFALMHKPSQPKIQNFRFRVYGIYFFIFLALTILPLLSNYFFPNLASEFNIIMHALEFINYSLYIMLAFIVINIRQSSNLTFFPKFTTGLIISGLGGLFYINTSSLQVNEILAHIFQAIGLIFLMAGIKGFQAYAKFLKFKDELAAYFCLMLILFYIVSVSFASALFKIIFPPFSAYLFIEFILIFQFIIYLTANKLTERLTNITEALSAYIPGEAPLRIPVIRPDEIGLLAEKINATSLLSWQKISQISKMAERERATIRIFETMRRISDKNIIKNTIINEINKTFNADKCFIALYDSVDDSFYYDKYSEHLPSKTLVNFNDVEEEALRFNQFTDLFKNNIEICFANIEEYIEKNSLHGTPEEKLLREYNIKSHCSIPINYASHLLGYVILQYTNDYHELNKEDLDFLKTMTTQIGIAIH